MSERNSVRRAASDGDSDALAWQPLGLARLCAGRWLLLALVLVILLVSARAGSPIQTQTRPYFTCSGYAGTTALAGMISCPGMRTHLPVRSKVMPW